MIVPFPEEWRDVPSQPRLQASSWGRVRLTPSAWTMPNGGVRSTGYGKPTYGTLTRKNRSGNYRMLQLTVRGVGTVKIAQLVCEAFHGPKPFPEAVVLHRDEDSTNNSYRNLRWGTRKENQNAPGFKAWCASRTDHLEHMWARRRGQSRA